MPSTKVYLLPRLLHALVRMQPRERICPRLPDSQVSNAQDHAAAASGQRHPPADRESPDIEAESTLRVWALSERIGPRPSTSNSETTMLTRHPNAFAHQLRAHLLPSF